MSEAGARASGVLVIDKPRGLTSAQVVSRVKRALGAKRVGHTGTLDPLATGVLPLCLGDATKLAGYLLADDKTYEAEILLGVETDTLDADGRVTSRRPAEAAAITEGALRGAIAALCGELDQIPPMYSALKQAGTRLHQLARAGLTVERPARRVTVHRFELLAFEPDPGGENERAAPRARVSIACSKGTYVRALARDLGTSLGCGAHVTSLRRVQAGPFAISMAIPLAELDAARARQALIAPAEAIAHLPGAHVPAERLREVANGRVMPWAAIAAHEAPTDPLRLLTPGGELLAIARIRGGEVAYERVFPEAARACGGP
jgi:tRNA pseudouridine55 synthase